MTSSEVLSGSLALKMHQGACFTHRIGHVIIGVICSCDSTSRPNNDLKSMHTILGNYCTLGGEFSCSTKPRRPSYLQLCFNTLQYNSADPITRTPLAWVGISFLSSVLSYKEMNTRSC